MSKKKILTVIGTRPEAIKMAILVQKLSKDSAFEHRLCLTGQHREMLDVVINFFNIKSDYDLNLMKPNQDLFDITSGVTLGMRDVLQDFEPDLVLVHGDTSSAFVTALTAFYKRIKVAHVEAGLRTYNLENPFPEEANRVLISKLATWHFAPTLNNAENLRKEGVSSEQILVTGNTVIDALHYAADQVVGFTSSVKDEQLISIFDSNQRIILITGHRRENFGEKIENICLAIKRLAIKNPDIFFVYPVHLNPNIKQPVLQLLSGIENVKLTHPLDYPDFVFSMKKSWMILTDSGGVQEEAPSLGVPVLVMRDNTERPEAVDSGTVKLVGASENAIVENVQQLIQEPLLYQAMKKAINPYGDGKATDRIVEFLKEIND